MLTTRIALAGAKIEKPAICFDGQSSICILIPFVTPNGGSSPFSEGTVPCNGSCLSK